MSSEWNIIGLCRCCYTEGDVRSLGVAYDFEGKDEIYSVMIREVFNIIISPLTGTNSASTYCICAPCVLKIRDAYLFKKQILSCEEKFTQFYAKGLPNFCEAIKTETDNAYYNEDVKDTSFLDDTEDALDNENDDEKLHSLKINFESVDPSLDAEDQPLSILAANKIKSDEDCDKNPATTKSKKLRCEYCPKQFTYSGSLEVHMKVHSGEKIYKCLLCDSEYGLNRDLTKHISEKHSVSGAYPCNFCQEVFDKASKLKTHLNTHKTEKFKCNFCDKLFQRKKGLKEHLKLHSGEKNFHCNLCNKSFVHNQTLKSHILTHTGERPHVCDICGRRFPQRTHLKRHIHIIHNNIKPYACKVCTKKFSSKSYLSIHERVHSGEKPFSCDVCNKNFTASTTLKVHMRIHTGIRPYRCSYCERTFSQMASFKLHERTHTGSKPFPCQICKKRFSDNGYLKIHMRIHNDEKPYVCSICKRSFRETGQLKRHMRVHTGIKPYTCKICNKQIGNLSKHMKVHSEDKPFSCTICNKQFSINGNLKLHMRIHSDHN